MPDHITETLSTFKFDAETLIRVAVFDGQPWWVASDLAHALDIGRTHDAVRGLDDDETRADTIRTSAGPRTATFVSESGMYSLVLRSRKPEAKRFRRWVTHEVIPEIMRCGHYSLPGAEPAGRAMPSNFAEALRALADSVEAEAAALAGKAAAQAEAAALKPGAEAWSVLADTARDYDVADAAKILNRDPEISIGRNRLFRWMLDHGMIYQEREGKRTTYKPYQAQVDLGRLALKLGGRWQHATTLEWHAGAPQMRITAKGLAYIHRKMGGTGDPEAMGDDDLALVSAVQ